MDELRMPPADERGVAKRGAGCVEPHHERRRLRSCCEGWIGERREIRRRHGAADEDVARSVACNDCRPEEVRPGAAEECRPHEPRIGDQRTRRIATIDVKTVPVFVDLPEAAREWPPCSVGQLLPG